jgi:hypothetical protein
MSYVESIITYLSKIGGENVQNTKVESQEMIVFNYTINSKDFNIAIFHSHIEDRIVLQLFTSLPNAYETPDLEFYQILEKLNVNSMIGLLLFSQKDEDYFISYKSNFIGDFNAGFSRDVELFITTSLQMVSYNHSELNVI